MWGVNVNQIRNLRGGLNAAHDASDVMAWLWPAFQELGFDKSQARAR